MDNVLVLEREMFKEYSFDFMKEKMVVCAQNSIHDTGNYLTRKYLDLVLYIRWFVSDAGSITVTKDLIEKAGMSEKEAWDIAIKNTKDNMVVSTYGQMLNELLNEFVNINGNRKNYEYLLILTNKRGIYGASSIYMIDEIREIAETLNDDLYIIPSSIHEILITPCKMTKEDTSLKRMIFEVNSDKSVVSREEFLSNNLYKYDLKNGIISIV